MRLDTRTRRDEGPEPGPGELDTDHVRVRALAAGDLDAIVRIDREATGRRRDAYYEGKIASATEQSGIAASLVAEVDDHVVGFLIARVYYGEFGRSEPTAVIDSIGVYRAHQRRKVGDALMRQLEMNLRALEVEHVETIVDWNDHELLQFLAHRSFVPVPRICLRKPL